MGGVLMKRLRIVFPLLCWALISIFCTGCQVLEFKEENRQGKLEFSNIKGIDGKYFNEYSTAWYIIDLGPVHGGTIGHTIRDVTRPQTHKAGLTVTTEFHWIDVISRSLQGLTIGVPIVGTRTIEVQGNEEL